MCKSYFTVLFASAALTVWAAAAQEPVVYATGLNNPSKIIIGPNGTLLIAEAGTTTPNTARVSLITASGARSTLLDALPSGVFEGGADGANGLLLEGNTLYVAIGQGDQLVDGTDQGTTVPNPKATSSPIFGTVLQVDFTQSPDRLTAPFTLKSTDQYTLADGNSVTLDNGSGDKAMVSVLSSFRFRPDAQTIYRNTHPYALARTTSDTSHVYMADAGLNSLVQIDTPSGRARTLVQFPVQPNFAGGGPPVSEAVPTSVHAYENVLLVTLFTGFPFGPANSRVVSVDPTSGAVSPFINWLSSAIDIAYRDRPSRAQFFVLEHSAALLAGAPGKLLVYNSTDGTVMLDNLNSPTSLALDDAAGKIYITSRAAGNVIQVDIGK